MEQRIDTLRDRLHELLGRIGSGSWRLRDDLVDLACDRAADCWIGTGGRIPIDRLEAYACVVLRNLVRKGPPRAALHAERTLDLVADLPVVLPDASSTYRVLPPLPETLSPAERQAVQATLMSATQRQAAKQAGMTPRDLRVRVGRAVEKIRVALEEHSSPPPPLRDVAVSRTTSLTHDQNVRYLLMHNLVLVPWIAVLSLAGSSVVGQRATGSVALAPNRVIRLDQGGGQQVVPVYTRDLMRSDVLGVTLQVQVDGREVSGIVSRSHEVASNLLSRSSRGGPMYRLDLFTIDLTPLSLTPGQRIDYRASVTGAEFEIFDSTTAFVAGLEAPDSCVTACVCAFVQELKAEKDPVTKKVRFESLTPQDIETAEKNLRDCLAECDPKVFEINSTKFLCHDSEGVPIVVRLDLQRDGNGGKGDASGTSDASGADVVIAIGGDAHPTASSPGGSALATAAKKGAATLAIGGMGGNNAGSPGQGGDATANSSHPDGGDSFGVGGDGGEGQDTGGDGGDGSGTTKCAGATGFGHGGDGGDPKDDSETGGKGGNGTGSRNSDATTVTGVGAGQPGGNPIGPGQHGQGGTGRSNLGGQTGTNGAALQNETPPPP